MTQPRNARISSRKQPRQARSNDLVRAILEAAVHVLAKEGAPRFTTARVAERAGVSIGSLYQYFPNKAAILFRLQLDEWVETATLLQSILEDYARPPLDRLRRLVHAFVLSECEEADMRVALNDAAPLYRDAPEARQARASSDQVVRTYMREILPDLDEEARQAAGQLIASTMKAAGKHFSETPRSTEEIAAYAGAMGDMFCAYIEKLQRS